MRTFCFFFLVDTDPIISDHLTLVKKFHAKTNQLVTDWRFVYGHSALLVSIIGPNAVFRKRSEMWTDNYWILQGNNSPSHVCLKFNSLSVWKKKLAPWCRKKIHANESQSLDIVRMSGILSYDLSFVLLYASNVTHTNF